jgi:hypothetical protein
VSKHAYQNLSKNLSKMHPKPVSLPNIHDHLHKQHFNICKSNLHDPNLSKSIQICLNMSINYSPQTKSSTPITYKLPKKHSVQKTNHYNTGYIPIITFQKIKSMSNKKKHQCFHSGLFFFSFDSIICNPFLMECTILFPLAAVEDVVTSPLLGTFVGFLESIQLLSLLYLQQ